MNPGGGSGWDEPPLDVQIPDDARELDRDLLAYRREMRAKRRRDRLRRVAGPFAGHGTVMPLLASVLAVCLVAGAMLSVATFSPATAPGVRTPRPTTAASTAPGVRTPQPTRAASTAPTAGPTTGRPAPTHSSAPASATGSAAARASATASSTRGRPATASPSATRPSGNRASRSASVTRSAPARPSGYASGSG